jgi:putative phosphoribosyl transferase
MRVNVPQVSSRPFSNRAEAGELLAARFADLADRDDVIVLGLPRGGVPVGYQVARSLRVPLDVFVVRKLGVPGREELAMGAIASGGVRLLNHDVVDPLGIPATVIDQVARREQAELERREALYRGDQPPISLPGKTVILVDDGLATGSTMRAAVAAIRHQEPARIIVAVPVGAALTCTEMNAVADDVVCLRTPDPFVAVGLWYRDFSETPDSEVRALLGRTD